MDRKHGDLFFVSERQQRKGNWEIPAISVKGFNSELWDTAPFSDLIMEIVET